MGGWGDEVEGEEVRWKESWKMGRFITTLAIRPQMENCQAISMVIFILAHLISIVPVF